MPYFKELLPALYLFLFFSGNLWAHKNFWEIKATALPEEESVSFTLMFSLDQLQETFKDKLGLKKYNPEDKNKVIEKLVALAPKIVSLEDSGRKLTPFVKVVNIFIDEGLENEKSLSLSSIDIDIELVFLTNSPELKGTWHVYADSLLKQKKIDLKTLPENALNVNIYFLDGNSSKFSVNSSQRYFTWKRTLNTSIPALKVTNKNLTVEAKPAYITFILFLLAIILWSFTSSEKITYICCSLLILSVLSYTTPIFSASKVIKQKSLPQEKAINSFMAKAIQKMYISSTSVNNRQKWESLKNICSENLKEKMYISNFSTEEKQVAHFIESIKIESIKRISNNSIECSWQANALFQHISHIHEKNMSFKGVFHFEAIGNTWLINDINIRRQL